MKTLQVVRQYLPSTGGMETYVSSLCRELQQRGHHADVATLDYLFKSDRPLPAYERIGGTDVIRLPSFGTPRYFVAPRLMELLPRYDLVHVHGVDFFIDMLGTLRSRHGTPVILSTHGGFFHTAWFSSFKKAYFKTITRTALKGVDRVIACSPRDREMFAPVTPRLCMVENGIDYSTYSGLEKDIRGEELLFVGRISKNKRVDRLIEALALVREGRPGATLTVVGPDWEGLKSGLEAKAARMGLGGAVTFTGVLPQEEMLSTLARARLFVSASEYEAFGLSAVEAMAGGTVPVLNNIEAFQEFIDTGENGFLVDYADTDMAAETISAALELPDERLSQLGARARETASRYDWEKVAGGIVAVYEEVMKEHHGNA